MYNLGIKAFVETFKLLNRLGIKNKDIIGMGGDIVKMGKSLFNTRINPKLLEYIAKNQKIPTKILENIKIHARTLKNATESQKNLFLANIKSIQKAKTPPKLKEAKILDIKTGHKIPAAGIKQLETKVGYPKNVHPQSTLGKAIDESRKIQAGDYSKTLADFKASYPKEFSRLGERGKTLTTKELKEMMFRLDTEGIPFETGGIAHHLRTR